MKIHLIIQGLNSHLNQYIKSNFTDDFAVVFTNITYPEDQKEMRTLLQEKYTCYNERIHKLFYPHNPVLPILNQISSKKNYVLDNFNLYVSNLQLSYNAEKNEDLSVILKELGNNIEYLKNLKQNQYINNLYIVSSEVDFDFLPKSKLGLIYQKLLFTCNKELVKLSDTVLILHNGEEIFLKREGM